MNMKKNIVLGMIMIVGCMTGCGSNVNNQTEANKVVNDAKTEIVSETDKVIAEEVVFSNDDYSITYNSKDFEQLDVRGAIHFNYCNAEVEQAGSNVIIITKEENCKLDDIVSTMVSSKSNVEDVYDSVMGSQEIPSKIFVETTDAPDGSGHKLVDNFNMIQSGDDVIIIEAIRTLGDDDGAEMTIDGAFVAILESFVLN